MSAITIYNEPTNEHIIINPHRVAFMASSDNGKNFVIYFDNGLSLTCTSSNIVDAIVKELNKY